jgi:hypothetical protein
LSIKRRRNALHLESTEPRCKTSSTWRTPHAESTIGKLDTSPNFIPEEVAPGRTTPARRDAGISRATSEIQIWEQNRCNSTVQMRSRNDCTMYIQTTMLNGRHMSCMAHGYCYSEQAPRPNDARLLGSRILVWPHPPAFSSAGMAFVDALQFCSFRAPFLRPG